MTRSRSRRLQFGWGSRCSLVAVKMLFWDLVAYLSTFLEQLFLERSNLGALRAGNGSIQQPGVPVQQLDPNSRLSSRQLDLVTAKKTSLYSN